MVTQGQAGDDVAAEYVEVGVAVLRRFRAAPLKFRKGNVFIAENKARKRMVLEVCVNPKAPFPEWFVEG